MSVTIGAISEYSFIVECLKREIAVSSPIVDKNGYDFVIQLGDSFVKVQVKSTSVHESGRKSCWKVNCNHGGSRSDYNKDHFDYIAIYIIGSDIWYILPFSEVKQTLRLYPNKIKHHLNVYRNAWHLLSTPNDVIGVHP